MTKVAQIATITGTAIAALTFLLVQTGWSPLADLWGPDDEPRTESSASPTTTATTGDRSPGESAPTESTSVESSSTDVEPPPALLTALGDLTPAVGARYFDYELALQSTTDDERVLAIRCPANQSGDFSRLIKYDVRAQFDGLVANVKLVGEDPTSVVLADVTVYADALRAGEPVRLSTGESATMNRDISGASGVSISVVCDHPDAYLLLVNAALEQQSR